MEKGLARTLVMEGSHCFQVVLKAKKWLSLVLIEWSDESIYSKHHTEAFWQDSWPFRCHETLPVVVMKCIHWKETWNMTVSQELHNVVCMNTGVVPACCQIPNSPNPFTQEQNCIVAAASGTEGWDWMSTRVTMSIIRQWKQLIVVTWVYMGVHAPKCLHNLVIPITAFILVNWPFTVAQYKTVNWEV